MGKCKVVNCDNISCYKTGLCNKHQWRFKKYGTTELPQKENSKDKICCVSGCNFHVHSNDFCKLHYTRNKRHGNPEIIKINTRGTGFLTPSGYVEIGINGKKCLQHIYVAEQIFGGKLPNGYVVHHKNGIRSDNRPENLQICTSTKEHHQIHLREKALKECGHETWRTCNYCKQWDAPENLKFTGKSNVFHKKCKNEYRKKKRLCLS